MISREDYCDLERLVDQFPWENWGQIRAYQLVWSTDRRSIDSDSFFDYAMLEVENFIMFSADSAHCPGLLSYCITIGDWLYFQPKDELTPSSRGSALLRRVKWDELEIVDVVKDHTLANSILVVKLLEK